MKAEGERENPRSQILPQTGDSELGLLVVWEKMNLKINEKGENIVFKISPL